MVLVITLVGNAAAIRSPSDLQESAWREADTARITCSSLTARAPRLEVAPRMLRVPTEPFGVTLTPNVSFVFAGLSNSVGVFARTDGRLRLRAKITVPEQALGVTLTPDGRYLVVADGYGGAYVLDVTATEHGSRSAVMGQLTSSGTGAIEASVSPNGKYVFVTLENSDELAVFNLHRAIATGFTRYTPVGMVPLAQDPVGIAMSPGGRYLYVTSEVAPPSRQGTLSTIDLATAETDPSRSILTTVPAGCSPVRAVVAHGSVYVTARGSDSILWFSSRSLARDPSHALRGSVRVGPEPVGLALVNRKTELLVADSNRFDTAPRANLALLHLDSDGRPTLSGYLRSGSFPREVAATRSGGQAFVTNYGSSQLESVSLPGGPSRT